MDLKKIFTIVFLSICLLGLVLFDATTNKVHNIKVRQETLTSIKFDNKLNDKLVCFFSDLNFGSIINENDLINLCDTINNYHPDIIIFGGDLFDENEDSLNGENVKILIQYLSSLKANYAKYAVYGDLDLTDNTKKQEVFSILDESDFCVLENSNRTVLIDGCYLNIVGVNPVTTYSYDIDSSFDNLNDSNYTFVVSHCPDIFTVIPKDKANYVLSGHSKKGQVYFPLINRLYRSEGAIDYFSGKKEEQGSTIDITSGVGVIKNSIRIFTNAEIVMYKLSN